MGDLNELVERLRIGTPENPEYEVVWVQNLRAHFKEGMFSRQFFPEWNDIFLANVNDLLAASTEAAAALTSLIAERDGLREALAALEKAATAYHECASEHFSDTDYDRDGMLAETDAELWVSALPVARTALSLDTNKGEGV